MLSRIFTTTYHVEYDARLEDCFGHASDSIEVLQMEHEDTLHYLWCVPDHGVPRGVIRTNNMLLDGATSSTTLRYKSIAEASTVTLHAKDPITDTNELRLKLLEQCRLVYKGARIVFRSPSQRVRLECFDGDLAKLVPDTELIIHEWHPSVRDMSLALSASPDDLTLMRVSREEEEVNWAVLDPRRDAYEPLVSSIVCYGHIRDGHVLHLNPWLASALGVYHRARVEVLARPRQRSLARRIRLHHYGDGKVNVEVVGIVPKWSVQGDIVIEVLDEGVEFVMDSSTMVMERLVHPVLQKHLPNVWLGPRPTISGEEDVVVVQGQSRSGKTSLVLSESRENAVFYFTKMTATGMHVFLSRIHQPCTLVVDWPETDESAEEDFILYIQYVMQRARMFRWIFLVEDRIPEFLKQAYIYRMRRPDRLARTKLIENEFPALAPSIELIADAGQGGWMGDCVRLCQYLLNGISATTTIEDLLSSEKSPHRKAPFPEMYTPYISYEDLIGMDDVKRELEEAIGWPLKYPQVLQKWHLPLRSHILLTGPSGSGKTALLEALPSHFRLPHKLIRGPELLQRWLGGTESAIRSVFAHARSTAPSLLLFDDFEVMGARRGASSASDAMDRIVNQLLTELDEMHNEDETVFVVMATSRPDLLDPALVRPGRVDRRIDLTLPSYEARVKYLQGKSGAESIAKGTEGFSFADLEVIRRQEDLHKAVEERRNAKGAVIEKHEEVLVGSRQAQAT